MKGDYKKQATTVGLVALILSAFLTSVNQIFYDWGIATGTFIACTILILAVVSGKSAVQMDITLPVIFALIASIGGVGEAVLCTMYSKKLNEAGWTTSMNDFS